MNVKFKDELAKLHILKLLELQNGILNIEKPINIEALAARLSCSPILLLEVLIAMDVEILEDA